VTQLNNFQFIQNFSSMFHPFPIRFEFGKKELKHMIIYVKMTFGQLN